jgi:hypothetical protein
MSSRSARALTATPPDLVQGGQREELRDAQARRLEMGIVEAGDLPARLPHREAVARIDPKRMVDCRHLRFLSIADGPKAERARHAKALRYFAMKAGTESADVPVSFSTLSFVPAKMPSR